MAVNNKLGFGFLRLDNCKTPDGEYDWESISKFTDRFIELGGRYFDTCYTYLDGKSEEGIRKCVVERHPRESYCIANKMPGYNCKEYADCRRFFDESLKRCGVDYFDVYMLHWLNRKHYRIAEEVDEFRFLREVKASGEAKYIGFSYHDSAELLDEILTAHPEVDVVQIQLNYIDWESSGIESRKCYEVCVKHGKKVVVMGPIKGGQLASLPEAADELLKSARPDFVPADWALNFVQSLPEVAVCLSGMASTAQVEENMHDMVKLTESDLKLLSRVRTIIMDNTAIPCTTCGYCRSHCPKSIRIPDYFKMYNEISRYPRDAWKVKPTYEQYAAGYGKASDCISCRRCESHCPQNIKIADMMKCVAEKLG